MQSSLRRRLFVPIVYIGVILPLLLLALFAKSFSESIGDARVSGRFSPFPLFNASTLEELTLFWNGLSLDFSQNAQPGLRRYEAADGQADIVFDGNARLRLSPSEGAGSLAIVPIAGSAASIPAVEIPFSISGIVDRQGQAGALLWRQGDRRYKLILPSGARIDYDARSIELPTLGQQGFRLVSLQPPEAVVALAGSVPAQRPTRASASRLPDERALPTPEQLSAAIGRFVDAAYAGWSSVRRNEDAGTWKMPDGTSAFDETIGVALLAEALNRGTFAGGLQIWTDALQQRGVDSAPVTSVYTGRTKDFVKQVRGSDDAETQRLNGLVDRSDLSFLSTPGAELFLLTRAGRGPAKEAETFLLSKGAAGLDTAGSLSLLEALLDYAQFSTDDPQLPEKARQLIDKGIFTLITAVDSAVFLRSGTGASVDVRQSVRAGSLLVRAGSLLQYARAAAMGRGLIASALALSSGAGYLPASLTADSGRITAPQGAIAPESVYRLLPMDRHLPRPVPLFAQLGDGAWVLTAAAVTPLPGSDSVVRLGFSYPIKVAHSLVFRGLRPFSEIRLHGIPWHADPSYASYSDGWSYDTAGRTLLMKITGRVDQEVVEIRF
ncbi:MAG TPA: hypothetical protein VMV03_06270 [Spirochaetia bacterium]|nr:hypothetical protein [Spirochaetia bacterium]